MIMLAGAMLATTGTGPRACATTAPSGPQGPTHPVHTTTSTLEDAQDAYRPVCSSHAAHWSTAVKDGRTTRCGAVRAALKDSGGLEERGVPSVVAIGPYGGRGSPSGGWALSLIHTHDCKLVMTDEVLDGRVAKEAGEKGTRLLRRDERQGGRRVTAAGPPTRGTTMLHRVHRLCAAADQWGSYVCETNFRGSNTAEKNVAQKTRERDARRTNKKKCGDHGKRKGSRENILFDCPVLCGKSLKARQSPRVEKSFFTVNRSRGKTQQPSLWAGKKTTVGAAKRVKKSRGKNPAATIINEKFAPPPWILPTKKIMNSLAGSRENILLASPVLCEKILKARQSPRVEKSFFTANRSREITHQPPQRAGKKTTVGAAKRVKKSRGKNPAANIIKEKKAPPPRNLPTKKIMNSLAGGGTKRWPPKAPPRKRWRWEFDSRTRRSTAPQHARKKSPRRRRQRGVGRARRNIDTTHRRKGRNR